MSDKYEFLIPKVKYGKCRVMAQGATDYTLEAFAIGGESEEHGRMLTIGAQEGAIYVTKEHAKAFFGLVEPSVREQALTNALRHAIDDIRDATANSTGDSRSYYNAKIAGYAKVLEGT